MRPAKSNTETYYAVKLRLRYFKFSGVRYIERDNAICLLKEYGKAKSKDFSELISELALLTAYVYYRHNVDIGFLESWEVGKFNSSLPKYCKR